MYVATGERHLREAGDSLRSLWRHEPRIPVSMYIDTPSRNHLGARVIPEPPQMDLLEVLDHPDPTYSWGDKPLALTMQASRQERVLLLDTDTRVCGSIGDMLDILEAFELAAAHAPIRFGRQPAALKSRAPQAFPELNTGVIVYRRTKRVAALFDRWWSLHREILQSPDYRAIGDQATFRIALYESDVRFAVLPPEYNCRLPFPTYIRGRVRILHGRGPDLRRVEREVNGSTGPRVFVPGLGVLHASGK
jgi:hypothetical protein